MTFWTLRIPVAAGAPILLALAGPALPAGASGVELTPHRAVYDMRLDRAESGSGVTGIAGRLVFELIGSECIGYAVNMRFISRIDGDQGGTSSDLRSATFEDAEAETFRFVSRSYLNDALSEETDGVAERTDEAIRVDLTKPEETTLSLPPEVMFPTEHLRAMIAAARAGETMFMAHVFDGSDTGHNVYETATVIGDRRSIAPESETAAAEALDGVAGWPVTVAYFDHSDGLTQTPKYEFSYDLHANGVSTRVMLDYGDFAMDGELSSIDVLDAAPCDAG